MRQDYSMKTIELQMNIASNKGVVSKPLGVQELVIAGWTGRDHEAMERHIEELVTLGVSRPKAMPVYYRISAARLSTAPLIEASGTESSGEVEFVLAALDGEMYVGVGSDHTDREVERYGVTVSKQVCDKPVSETFWPYSEVADHWDQLMLRSYATIGGARHLYQEGSVTTMLAPDALIRGYCGDNHLGDGVILFGGTLPAIGGIRPADRFEAEIEDPILERKIAIGYDLRSLPVHG